MIPSGHPKYEPQPDGSIRVIRGDGSQFTLPTWEKIRSDARTAPTPVEESGLLPLSPAAKKWAALCAAFPEIRDLDDVVTPGSPPPCLPDKTIRQLAGTFCSPQGEPVVAALADFVLEIVRAELRSAGRVK